MRTFVNNDDVSNKYTDASSIIVTGSNPSIGKDFYLWIYIVNSVKHSFKNSSLKDKLFLTILLEFFCCESTEKSYGHSWDSSRWPGIMEISMNSFIRMKKNIAEKTFLVDLSVRFRKWSIKKTTNPPLWILMRFPLKICFANALMAKVEDKLILKEVWERGTTLNCHLSGYTRSSGCRRFMPGTSGYIQELKCFSIGMLV